MRALPRERQLTREDEVVGTMAEHPYGSAVVMQNEKTAGARGVALARVSEPGEATMDIQSGSFRSVHATVLRQHAELRARLRGLDGAAAPDGSSLSEAHLRISLLRLAVLFEDHLQFEETELAPRIREIDAWGPEREAALLAEHVEQRTRLQRACIAAEDPDASGLELAHSISALVVTMLEDMAREEHELAELEELDGDSPCSSSGQMTG